MGIGDDVAVLGDEEAGALARATARMQRAVVVARFARHLEAAEELVQARRQVVKALRDVVGNGGDLGLHLHADDGRLHLLDDRREVGRGGGVDAHRFGEGDVAVRYENPGAGGADDAEGEDAGEQRVADAPGPCSRIGDVGHGSRATPIRSKVARPERSGADRRSARPALGGEYTVAQLVI